ncbi:MAG TPA: M56 family metallopeptidase, partial [Lacipirellulaceae bacterium]|nr:M56 family metallopeptidase [Lacipirellulaceae bacterium]
MNQLLETIANWLADYYLLSTVLLALSFAVLSLTRQPARRRALAQSATAGLFLLAALCAMPGWSMVSLLTHRPTTSSPQASHESHELQSADDAPVVDGVLPNNAGASHIMPTVSTSKHAAATPASSDASRQFPWPALVALAWSGGALAIVMWLAIGSFAASRLRREAQPASSDLVELMKRLSTLNMHVRCRVELLVSNRIDVAVAQGIFRPAVLLPAKWANEFPLPFREGPGEGSDSLPSDLRTILTHELAHIENRDLHWLAAMRALLTLLWAQPLYWLLRRRLRLDQEALADAAAAEVTSRQSYAEQLVAWARDIAARPAIRLTPAVGLWECPSQLRQRIALLIDERFTVLRSCSRRWQLAAVAVCSALAVALSLVTFAPAQPKD